MGHEMTIEIYLAYVLACVLIAIVPGPTVTVIVANSLAHGTRAGLLNVAGTQLGLGLMMAILIVGVELGDRRDELAVRLAAHRGRDLSRVYRLEAHPRAGR